MAALASLSDLKTYLNITAGNADAELTRLLNAASAMALQHVERELAAGSRTERRHGTGKDVMLLRDTPVATITSLTIGGSPVVASDGNTTGFIFDQGPEIFLIGQCFPRGRLNVVVTYTAGYNPIPDDVQHAVIEIAAQGFKEKDWVGFTSKSIGGENVSFLRSGVPESARMALASYKRIYPLD